MILDKHALLSDKQAVTATAPSTNVYDLGEMASTNIRAAGGVFAALKRRLGYGNKIPFALLVNEDFTTSAGMTALTIDIEVDATNAFAGAEKKVASVTILIAELVKGKYFPFDKLPRGITERYLRVKFTPVTGDADGGTITAGFVAAVDGNNSSEFL